MERLGCKRLFFFLGGGAHILICSRIYLQQHPHFLRAAVAAADPQRRLAPQVLRLFGSVLVFYLGFGLGCDFPFWCEVRYQFCARRHARPPTPNTHLNVLCGAVAQHHLHHGGVARAHGRVQGGVAVGGWERTKGRKEGRKVS